MRRKIGHCCSCKKQLLFAVFRVVVGFGFLVLNYYDKFSSSSHLTKLQCLHFQPFGGDVPGWHACLGPSRGDTFLFSSSGTPLTAGRLSQSQEMQTTTTTSPTSCWAAASLCAIVNFYASNKRIQANLLSLAGGMLWCVRAAVCFHGPVHGLLPPSQTAGLILAMQSASHPALGCNRPRVQLFSLP